VVLAGFLVLNSKDDGLKGPSLASPALAITPVVRGVLLGLSQCSFLKSSSSAPRGLSQPEFAGGFALMAGRKSETQIPFVVIPDSI